MPTHSAPPASGSTALLQLTWQHLLHDAKLSSSVKTQTHNHQIHWGKESMKGLEQSPVELAGYWNKILFRGDENTWCESKQCFWHTLPGTPADRQRGLASNAPVPAGASPAVRGASCSAEGRTASPWGVLRQLQGPRCAGPPLDQQPSAAAVSPRAWWGRHSHHGRDHRATGRAGACHGTPRIWAEQEPALPGRQPALPHSGEVCLVHLTLPHLHGLCDMLILSTGLF